MSKKTKVVDTKLCLTNIYFSATGCSMILARTLDDSLKVLIGQGIWDNVQALGRLLLNSFINTVSYANVHMYINRSLFGGGVRWEEMGRALDDFFPSNHTRLFWWLIPRCTNGVIIQNTKPIFRPRWIFGGHPPAPEKISNRPLDIQTVRLIISAGNQAGGIWVLLAGIVYISSALPYLCSFFIFFRHIFQRRLLKLL